VSIAGGLVLIAVPLAGIVAAIFLAYALSRRRR
jgi:uncharacterized membrane protein required for colicin V production